MELCTDDFLRTKIFWKQRLPYFLTHGAPLRALCARVLRYEARRTEQKFPEEEKFPHICLDWHDIYELPINALIDTKSGEFHDRILNRYLTTNSFHFKICLANSALQYDAQYPDSTSIRTLKTKTQFFRRPS